MFGDMDAERMTRIPLSTYRWQFNRSFTFVQAAEIVPYLAALGISHCYASPYLRARSGSMHGYDIIDHNHLNPEIGTAEDYHGFISVLHAHGMGQILDIVPNHMGVMGSDNGWWLDVLENGQTSSYADYFDIDWEPLKDELQGKVLVPVLGDHYGTILERGELRLVFQKDRGEFSIFYFQHRFPVDPREYTRILAPAAERMAPTVSAQDENLLELQSLIAAFDHLPAQRETSAGKRAERVRDKEIHKRRLAALCQRSQDILQCVSEVVRVMNGSVGHSSSFEQLHELIKAQAFRLAHWRVAADDINYRRFFDVNDLAALRQENEAVFQATHALVLELLRDGNVDGLRIDHPDGLYNPQLYFRRLQAASDAGAAGETSQRKPHYVIAEKILTGDENLATAWPMHGTTGYEFSSLVNGLFVDCAAEVELDRLYAEFIGGHSDFRQMVYQCKKLMMDRSLNSELNVLANHLSRIALSNRHTCDFTVKSLRDALTEIVACFPVYRTYVTERQASASDRKHILEAVECAKRTGAADPSVCDFIANILLTRQAEGHSQPYQRSVIHFAMRFQQYTSAVMAKGLEDTSYYRYHRLISLNDVGSDPMRFGVTPEEFHRETQERARTWPHSMNSGSTHDSKRSEDVRARINVLSEIPQEWARQVWRWRDLNRGYKGRVENGASSGSEIPSANDEYLLYQTLVGSWPVGVGEGPPPEPFVHRIREYMIKALREAKVWTSWGHQNASYELGVVRFVDSVMGSEQFRAEFLPFQHKAAHFGRLNSLAQLLIRLTAPGVPDVYQGSELWEFNLVDPDNRRPLDYGARQRALQQIRPGEDACPAQRAEFASRLAARPEDGCVKMYLLWQALRLRQRMPELFQEGHYVPLQTFGVAREHVLAFARQLNRTCIVVAVPRLSARLLGNETKLPLGKDVWCDTGVALPPLKAASFQNLLTGETLTADNCHHGRLQAAQVFAKFPVALLIADEGKQSE
jgi:(1->4)-alpha-D-glucan 1-alpha-D-glucosylmutase